MVKDKVENWKAIVKSKMNGESVANLYTRAFDEVSSNFNTGFKRLVEMYNKDKDEFCQPFPASIISVDKLNDSEKEIPSLERRMLKFYFDKEFVDESNPKDLITIIGNELTEHAKEKGFDIKYEADDTWTDGEYASLQLKVCVPRKKIAKIAGYWGKFDPFDPYYDDK